MHSRGDPCGLQVAPVEGFRCLSYNNPQYLPNTLPHPSQLTRFSSPLESTPRTTLTVAGSVEQASHASDPNCGAITIGICQEQCGQRYSATPSGITRT